MNRVYYKTPDFKLLIAVYILLAFGISMLYSASIAISRRIYHNQYYIFTRQLIWAGISTVFIIILFTIDYHLYRKVARLIVLFTLILLVMVLIPGIGTMISGSRSWIRFKFFGFQPAEIAKLSLVIYLSYIFSKKRIKTDNFFESYLPTLIIVSTISFLILLQPDFGTGFLIIIIAGTLAFISGVKTIYLISTGFAILPIAWILISKVEYRKMRLLAFINPWADPMDKGYHIIQSIKSFKIGGITGVGLGKGVQKLWYLPQPHTDFIFSVIGEETGLIGSFIILLLYIYIIFRAAKIAMNAPDRFGFLIATGICIMISVQVLINIFVSTGLIPVTGLPLPFISYGGSSLVVNMLAIGILLNISRQSADSKRSLEVIKENE